MTESSNDTNAATPFVVKEGRHYKRRYWIFMTVLLFVIPIGLDLLDGTGIKTWRLIEVAVWVLLTLFVAFFPRQTLATIDINGITFRKRGLLTWHDIQSIELIRERKRYGFFMKWAFGTDEVLRFMLRNDAHQTPSNWQQRASVNRFGSTYSFAAFVTGPPLKEIADACKRFADLPLLDKRAEPLQ